MDDPFKTSTASQYCRLAGLISVVSLLVGYDPTRIRGWIGIVPGPRVAQIEQTTRATIPLPPDDVVRKNLVHSVSPGDKLPRAVLKVVPRDDVESE
jgi:hypothetical protein